MTPKVLFFSKGLLSLSILMLKLSQNWPVLALQVDLCVHLTPPSNSLNMYVLLYRKTKSKKVNAPRREHNGC